MKTLTLGWLILMLSWNAALGVLGTEQLCLHEDLSAHLKSDDVCHAGNEGGHEDHVDIDACPPCVDLELRAIDLRPERPANPVVPELTIAPVTIPDEGRWAVKTDSPPQPEVCRGPPRSPATAVLVARTTVLRL